MSFLSQLKHANIWTFLSGETLRIIEKNLFQQYMLTKPKKNEKTLNDTHEYMNGYRMSASCEWTWTLPVLIAEFIDIVHIEAAYLNIHLFAVFSDSLINKC